MFRAIAAAALIALAAPSTTLAAAPAPAAPTAAQAAAAERELQQKIEAFDAQLTKRTGAITLDKADVVLNLGEANYWIDAADAKKVLVDGWGNMPDQTEGVLGMIFPAGAKTVGDGVWGAVLTYEKTGYVSDEDARTTDYDKLLEQLREGEEEINAARGKAGHATVNLVGWAQSPSYDAARHSVIWARNLKFGGESENTLNYDVRVLGRKGVLSLNIVGSMRQLPEVRTAGEALQGVASFTPGARYADYKKGDKKAAYGIGGLILAGAGVAAAKKAGLIAVALIFLKRGWFVIAGVVMAAFGWFRRRRAARKPETIEFQAPQDDDAAGKDDGKPGGPAPWS